MSESKDPLGSCLLVLSSNLTGTMVIKLSFGLFKWGWVHAEKVHGEP